MRFQFDITQNLRIIQFGLEQSGIVNPDSNQTEGMLLVDHC